MVVGRGKAMVVGEEETMVVGEETMAVGKGDYGCREGERQWL